MKLSFSFSKSAAPKRKPIISSQNAQDASMREIVQISTDSGVVLEKTSLGESDTKDLIIEVKTRYSRPRGQKRDYNSISFDKPLSLETVGGIIPSVLSPPVEPKLETNGDPERPSKRTQSILMQIMEARNRGHIQDAPDVDKPRMDPEQFGWALLRGMGYDTSHDSSPAARRTASNQEKAGLGSKNQQPPRSM